MSITKLKRFFHVMVLFSFTGVTISIECLKDEDEGWTNPNNIYQCADDKDCCLDDGVMACCEPGGAIDPGAMYVQLSFIFDYVKPLLGT